MREFSGLGKGNIGDKSSDQKPMKQPNSHIPNKVFLRHRISFL
jgi:hypothetical protein